MPGTMLVPRPPRPSTPGRLDGSRRPSNIGVADGAGLSSSFWRIPHPRPTEGAMTLVAALVWTLVAQGPGAALSGTVVGVGGEPIVGAELILVGPTGSVTTVLARATSGEGGRFTLDRPAGLAGDHDPERSP